MRKVSGLFIAKKSRKGRLPMPKKKLPQTIEEFFVAGLGLAEGLDARNAADVFHGGVIQRLCRGDGALELLVITAEHGRKAESSRRNSPQLQYAPVSFSHAV
jgi:hypothetical protein